ncbi:hypothetical protein HER10_EVM0010290 [Colletotrichum scovillei]|uniref:uncharacterized protein n=1 Tax=Colletotrichum scovillei TaxID=1209932 RepID=UPI0015C3E59D|nr:uncharacterized protein HER10_EVM0010290 [Colletotrichum scovillei]KAF4783465.1 hypothetical protein HER10_EVM0010290 [Colletotrichum scovillei]
MARPFLKAPDPIALAIVMPTESASLPLDKLKTPLGQQEPGVPATRQVISEGMGKETCGFFRTGGGRAGVMERVHNRRVLGEISTYAKVINLFPELAVVTCTAGTGASRIACHNTGRWLCGSLYSTCLGPAETICKGKTENGERTLCWYVKTPHRFTTPSAFQQTPFSDFNFISDTLTQPLLFKQHRKPRLRHPPPRLRRKPENRPSLLRRRLQDEIRPDPRVEYVADLHHGPATATVIVNIVVVFAFGYVQAPDCVCEILRYPNDRHTLGVCDE